MSYEGNLSVCWRRREHLKHLIQELSLEPDRITAAVEWASSLGAPTSEIMAQIKGHQESISQAQESIKTAFETLDDKEASLDDMRDCLDNAINEASGCISWRMNFISALAFHIVHPSKRKA